MNNLFYIEIYVGMGKLVSWWHQHALGFQLRGKRIQKGKFGNEVTYWLTSGSVNLLITSALDSTAHDVILFFNKHGIGLKRIAIEVENLDDTIKKLLELKVVAINRNIKTESDSSIQTRSYSVKLFDDNEILFIERSGDLASFLPNFEKNTEDCVFEDTNQILSIDHFAAAMRVNESLFWGDYICKILNLTNVQKLGEEYFSGMKTGMSMNVYSSQQTNFDFVIVEPLITKGTNSQVDVFLENHLGNGIQHIAYTVVDLVSLISKLKNKGVTFVKIPNSYYDDLEKEFPELPIKIFRDNNILCESDGDQLLLQIFTEPIGDRPTLFYEFIERINNYKGFGLNNIKNLFKSLE